VSDENGLGPEEVAGSYLRRAEAFLNNLGISEISYAQLIEDAVRHAATPRPALPALPANQAWVPVGPRNVGGRITAIAQDPTNPLILYAGSAHGGLWRTIDGGDTWEHLGEAEHNFPIGAIVVPEQDPTILYIGTGSTHPAYASGRGLYRVSVATPHGAAVFNRMVPAHPANMPPAAVNNIPAMRGAALRYTRLRLDPYDKDRFWAASQSGLWRWEPHPASGPPTFVLEFPPASIASGETPPALAAAVPPPGSRYPSYATDMLVGYDPRDREPLTEGSKVPRYLALYVAIDGDGVYRGRFDKQAKTTEWEKNLAVPHPATAFSRIRLALCEHSPQRVYALMDDTTDHPTAVYRSNNNGDDWAATTNSFNAKQNQASYDLVLEVSPVDPDLVYAGIVDAYLSRDGGGHWDQILFWRDYNDLGDYAQHADQHAAVFDRFERRRLWVGNDGGLALARDLHGPLRARNYWRMRSHGIAAGQFQDVAVNPTPNLAFMSGGGLQDNGTWVSFGGPTWIHAGWADGGYFAFDPGNTRRYVFSQDYAVTAYTIVPPSPRPNIFNPIIYDLPESLAPQHAMGLNNSVVGGLVGPAATSPFVPMIAQNPATPGQLIIGWIRSGGKAAAYSSINSGATVNPLVGLSAVITPPGTEGTAACFGPQIIPAGNVDGWVGFSNGNLLHTTNAPAGNWVAPANALPWGAGISTQSISRIIVHPADERIVVVCTSGSAGRVFITYDRGTSWQDLTARVPSAIAVTPAAPSIPANEKRQFIATANFTDGSSFDATTSVTWASSDPTKATFSTAPGEEGQLTTLAAGPTTVTATLNVFGTAVNNTTVVTVTASAGTPPTLPAPARGFDLKALPPSPMTSLAYDQTTPTRLFVGCLAGVYMLDNVPSPGALVINPAPVNVPLGHTRQLTALCTFSDGVQRDVTTEVDWSVAPAGIVNFGAAPARASQVTGVALGAATVTARRGTQTANAAVAVAAAPPGPIPAAPPPPAAAVAPAVAFNWRPFNPGLPLTLVNDITPVPGTNMLRIATFGRGIWDCDLAATTRPQHKLFIRQTLVEDGLTVTRTALPVADDPRLPAGTVALDLCHAFDIRIDTPPYNFFDDRVDGVEFDERLGADTLMPFVKNAIYVQVHNAGREAVPNVEVHLYFRLSPIAAPNGPAPVPLPVAPGADLGAVAEFYNHPGFNPTTPNPETGATWTRVAAKIVLPSVGPGAPAVARFDWIPPVALAGHEVALLALCSGPDNVHDQLPAAAVAGPGVSAFIPQERRTALRIVHMGDLPLPDLYIRNAVDDDGRRNSVLTSTRSPDIIVVASAPASPPAVAFRDLLDIRPQDHLHSGSQNWIYIRVHNRGSALVKAEVELWAVKIKADMTPDFLPANWQLLTPASPGKLEFDVPANDWALGSITWTAGDPAPGEANKSYILVALIKSGDNNDPLPDKSAVTSLASFWDFLGRRAGSDNVAGRALRVVP